MFLHISVVVLLNTGVSGFQDMKALERKKKVFYLNVYEKLITHTSAVTVVSATADRALGGASVNTVRFQTSAAVAAIIKNVNRGNVWAEFHQSCNLTASAGAADRWLFKFISLWGRSRLNQPANGLSKLQNSLYRGAKRFN